MAYKTCQDCGCRIYEGHCVNCHEEYFIYQQYMEDDLPLPDPDSNFMRKLDEQLKNPNEK